MIIDASVPVKWFIPEDRSDLAFELVRDHPLRAPALLMTGVANALWKKLRRGELSDKLDLLARHADLGGVLTIVEGGISKIAVRALELGLSLDHAIHDRVYLAIAEAEDDVLVTADDEFRRKIEPTVMSRYVEALAA
jgi:predicted nucleic acid-binding protein